MHDIHDMTALFFEKESPYCKQDAFGENKTLGPFFSSAQNAISFQIIFLPHKKIVYTVDLGRWMRHAKPMAYVSINRKLMTQHCVQYHHCAVKSRIKIIIHGFFRSGASSFIHISPHFPMQFLLKIKTYGKFSKIKAKHCQFLRCR